MDQIERQIGRQTNKEKYRERAKKHIEALQQTQSITEIHGSEAQTDSEACIQAYT